RGWPDVEAPTARAAVGGLAGAVRVTEVFVAPAHAADDTRPAGATTLGSGFEFRHSAGVSSPDSTRLVFGLVAAPEAVILAAFDELAAWMRTHAGVDLERRTAATYQDLATSVRE